MSEPIGLIAGEGKLPVLVAKGMRDAGRTVCTAGFAGHFDDELRDLSKNFRTVGVFRVAQWARVLRKMGVREAIMVGRVDKSRLMHDGGILRFVRIVPDIPTLRTWYGKLRHDHRTPAILAAIGDILEGGGVTLIDSTTYIPDQMATEGVMTSKAPTEGVRSDIAFGWPLLAGSLKLHIGQALAVREGDVIAVEAVEGTDRMMLRAGELCRRGGWTLLKTASPDHDRRGDVPTVGEQTIRSAAAAGCACIAVGAGDVIIVEKEKTLKLADELGVCVIGLPRDAG